MLRPALFSIARRASAAPATNALLFHPTSSRLFSHSLTARADVFVEEDTGKSFVNKVTVGDKHSFLTDEPIGFGEGALVGSDKGPSPYDMLLASLGTCTNMTLRLYAQKKGYPLEKVSIKLSHKKIYAKDCDTCEKTKTGKLDRIDREIVLNGKDLTEAQRQDLMRIADLCPIHKTLHSESMIVTKLIS
ncbi:Osmotically inducible protein C [Balamuthia mandrillaris]